MTQTTTIESVRATVCGADPFASGLVVVFSSAKPEPHGDGQNEDAFALLEAAPGHGVIAVADGAGGLPGGAKASAAAVQALRRAVKQAQGEPELRSAILDGFERANAAILELGIGAATTLAAVEIRGNSVRSFHAGDSAVLVTGQRGKLKQLTISHAPVSYAVEAGMLDQAEALHHEDLNLVSNFVGSASMRIEVGPVLDLAMHDTVVVGSDGLFDNLHPEEIVEQVRVGSLKAAGRELADTCLNRMTAPEQGQPSKPDDLTFVAFRLDPGFDRRSPR